MLAIKHPSNGKTPGETVNLKVCTVGWLSWLKIVTCLQLYGSGASGRRFHVFITSHIIIVVAETMFCC